MQLDLLNRWSHGALEPFVSGFISDESSLNSSRRGSLTEPPRALNKRYMSTKTEPRSFDSDIDYVSAPSTSSLQSIEPQTPAKPTESNNNDGNDQPPPVVDQQSSPISPTFSSPSSSVSVSSLQQRPARPSWTPERMQRMTRTVYARKSSTTGGSKFSTRRRETPFSDSESENETDRSDEEYDSDLDVDKFFAQSDSDDE
eukprot:m.202587 g.202587  ORF g.202587 m.202587 type:complete len:200 (-) comp25984_c2_seq2:78-677(-)